MGYSRKTPPIRKPLTDRATRHTMAGRDERWTREEIEVLLWHWFEDPSIRGNVATRCGLMARLPAFRGKRDPDAIRTMVTVKLPGGYPPWCCKYKERRRPRREAGYVPTVLEQSFVEAGRKQIGRPDYVPNITTFKKHIGMLLNWNGCMVEKYLSSVYPDQFAIVYEEDPR